MRARTLLLILIVAITQFGCDKIEAPYREEVVTPDFCSTGIDDSIVNKKVLVEDYTGHGCGNCPAAGVYLNDTLKPIYNHCLVVISVHAGFFAGTCPNDLICSSFSNPPANSFMTNYACTPGNTWNTFFGISGNPKGMVDRIDFPSGAQSKTYNAWAPAISTELTKDAQAKIKITNTYSQSNNSVSVSVASEFLDDLSGDYKLQVVITEDSLPDWQLWYSHTPSEYVGDYMHRHVLRASLNSDWGETIASGSATKGMAVTKNYNLTLDNAWVTTHCSIVAFIYNDVTKEVVQVEEAPVN